MELASALWKKAPEFEISELQAVSVLAEAQAATGCVPYDYLIKQALALRHPVYDCIFLALAEAMDTMLVTADRKFAEACRDTEHSRRLEVI